ncbi:MAG: LysM peptidoglycan-binding domain-containing protein [Methylococcales bacterium]
MFFRTAFTVLCLLISSTTLRADNILLNPSHPDRYSVVKGDTLWDIAARFLQNPWKWPEVWEYNPQIKNPDLIYPGDTISLTYVDGKPRLTLHRGSQGNRVGITKLSPKIRTSEIKTAIPLIPIGAIQQFLKSAHVVAENELDRAPYIVSFAEGRLLGSAGDKVYVRSITDDTTAENYKVLRAGHAYNDGETGEILGYEAIHVADSYLQRTGDPATLLLSRTTQQVKIGDRLVPAGDDLMLLSYIPHKADKNVNGRIISVLDGVSQIGQYNVVVLDRGTRNGIEVGHFFDIYQSGIKVRDTVMDFDTGRDIVTLPDEKAGVLMVFRTFERVSYALVMYANRPLHAMDSIRNY